MKKSFLVYETDGGGDSGNSKSLKNRNGNLNGGRIGLLQRGSDNEKGAGWCTDAGSRGRSKEDRGVDAQIRRELMMKGIDSPPRITPAYASCSPETETESITPVIHHATSCLCRGLIKILFFKKINFSLAIYLRLHVLHEKEMSPEI